MGVRWYIISFLSGSVTSASIIMLVFRFYVDVRHPYWIFFSVLFIVQVIILLLRGSAISKKPLTKSLFIALAQATMFVLGGVGAFYFLMAIYPPNFS